MSSPMWVDRIADPSGRRTDMGEVVGIRFVTDPVIWR